MVNKLTPKETRKLLTEVRDKINQILAESEGVDIDVDKYGDNDIVLRYFPPGRTYDTFKYTDEIKLEPTE